MGEKTINLIWRVAWGCLALIAIYNYPPMAIVIGGIAIFIFIELHIERMKETKRR